MINLDKLVEVGISISQATDISAYLSNAGYVADFTESDLVDGVAVPESKIMVVSSAEDVQANFKDGTKYSQDLVDLFMQKNNAKPNQGKINNVFIYQKTTEDDFGAAFSAFFAKKADYAQVNISSKKLADIQAVARLAELNNRLFVGQTEEAVTGLGSYANTKILHHPDTESLDTSLTCVMANSNLGSVGDLYSKFSGVNPQEYTSSQMNEFDAANVAYYSTVNPINGGGVSQYGTPILYGNKQANGEITKRRYIRYTIDLLLKAGVIDFLAKKLSYQESSNNVLEGMLKAILINCQSNDLIIKDSEDTQGLYLKAMPLSQVRKLYAADYSKQIYRVMGWYIDALTGTKVIIDLAVNPTDAEKSAYEI